MSSASIRAQQSHQKLKKAHGALLIGILRRCTAPVSPRQPAHPTLKKIFNLFSTISHGPGNTQSWHQHLNVDAQEQWDFNPVRAESRALPLAGMFLITFHRGDEPAAEKISSYMSLFLLMMSFLPDRINNRNLNLPSYCFHAMCRNEIVLCRDRVKASGRNTFYLTTFSSQGFCWKLVVQHDEPLHCCFFCLLFISKPNLK